MISFSCPNCQKALRVKDEAAGKRARCSQCATVVTIPGAAPSPGPPPVPVVPIPSGPMPPPLPARSPVDRLQPRYKPREPAPVPVEPYLEPDPAAPRPTTPPPPSRGTSIHQMRRGAPPQKTAGSGLSLGFRFDWVSRILLVLGIAVLIFGVQESRVSSGASETPQNMTCQTLADHGPGDNSHIRLTDFVALSTFLHKGKPNDSSWQTVYIPIVPRSELTPAMQAAVKRKGSNKLLSSVFDSRKIRIFLKSTHAHDQQAVDALIKRTSIDGMVVNKIETMTHEDNVLLTSAYPLMDIPDAWVFEEGREPRGGLGMVAVIGGIALILGAIGNTLRPR